MGNSRQYKYLTVQQLKAKICPRNHSGFYTRRRQFDNKRAKFYWVIVCTECTNESKKKSTKRVKDRKALEAFALMGTC